MWYYRRVIIIASILLLLFVGSSGFTLEREDLQIHSTALLVRTESSSFSPTPVRTATGPNTYLTSAAVSPWDRSRILVSTTFLGLYESLDGGRTWIDLGEAEQIEALYRGSGFYEDISAVGYDPHDRDVIYVELAQTGEVLRIVRGGTDSVSRQPGSVDLFSNTVRTGFERSPDTDEAELRRRRAGGKRAFYLSTWQLDRETLEDHLTFAERRGLNAVVIDFKDDLGRIPYATGIRTAQEAGAVQQIFSAERVIQSVHDADLYLIGRIVVFKDKNLYAYENYRYALRDLSSGEPWGVFREGEQVEHWVDPYSEFVWDYNISLARELVDLGVDEIQFDYIRTPSDGETWNIQYRFKRDSIVMTDEDPFIDDRVEALAGFLDRARSELSVPISIDVFGFNGWYRMGYLGQDIGFLAPYVDVICPMLYPSHFAVDFADELPYMPRAQFLYREGVSRARRIAGETTLIRPYIQSFLIGGELQFEEPEYTDYLKYQIAGAVAGGADGYTLWNYSGRYYMVARGLDPETIGR